MQDTEQKYIYHYTSLENAMNIIQPRQLVFWGSRYDCMNDPFDSIYAKKILLDLPTKKEGDSKQEEYLPITDYIPYIVSFSKNRDDALMWRLYNAQVCLKISKQRIINTCDPSSSIYYKCKDCMYMSKKQIKININNILKDCSTPRERWEKAMEATAFIKHPDFKCENEVRVVDFSIRKYFHEKTKYNEKRGEIPYDFKYKKILNDNKIAYYKEFHFDSDILCGIIVMSKNDSEFIDIREHLEMWLYKCGRENFPTNFIQKSRRVPVR